MLIYKRSDPVNADLLHVGDCTKTLEISANSNNIVVYTTHKDTETFSFEEFYQLLNAAINEKRKSD